MKRHWLMKQQTTTTRQKGGCVQQRRICLFFLSLSPFHKSPLISLFPCVPHIASSLLQARVVKCMHKKTYCFLTERPWENYLLYNEITNSCCKNLYVGKTNLRRICYLCRGWELRSLKSKWCMLLLCRSGLIVWRTLLCREKDFIGHDRSHSLSRTFCNFLMIMECKPLEMWLRAFCSLCHSWAMKKMSWKAFIGR